MHRLRTAINRFFEPAERLRRLEALHGEGPVTDDEYQAKRAENLAEL